MDSQHNSCKNTLLQKGGSFICVGKEKRTAATFHAFLSLFAQNLCDSVSDGRSGLFDFSLSETSSQTDFERRKHRLLRSDGVWERLEASHEYPICENLGGQSVN
jgi:hypothetical protein